MLENQFIVCSSTSLADAKKRKVLPIPQFSAANHIGAWRFFYDTPEGYFLSKIRADDETGKVTETTYSNLWGDLLPVLGYLRESESWGALQYINTYFNIGDVFYICLHFKDTNQNSLYRYSQPLVLVPADDFVNIEYRCYEDAFGFPFAAAYARESSYPSYKARVAVNVPIRMHKPQPIQDDKTYICADGSVVTLYSKYYKEWECETEFLSEADHDKIIAALSCDEVFFNGTRVTKTDSYKIDWENYDLDCDGVTKLAKATFKVRANVTQRNSNY